MRVVRLVLVRKSALALVSSSTWHYDWFKADSLDHSIIHLSLRDPSRMSTQLAITRVSECVLRTARNRLRIIFYALCCMPWKLRKNEQVIVTHHPVRRWRCSHLLVIVSPPHTQNAFVLTSEAAWYCIRCIPECSLSINRLDRYELLYFLQSGGRISLACAVLSNLRNSWCVVAVPPERRLD
jgi:hypothetical protein